MGIMVYSLLWVVQDFDHQPYEILMATRFRVLSGKPIHPVPCALAFFVPGATVGEDGASILQVGCKQGADTTVCLCRAAVRDAGRHRGRNRSRVVEGAWCSRWRGVLSRHAVEIVFTAD